jgi:hypothetical protein
MRNIWLGVLLLASCYVAFGQLSSYSITITASRSTVLQPDQAVFGISVTSSLNTGLDQVVTALQGSGITSANLSSVLTEQQYNGSPVSSTVLMWSFTLAVPISQIQTTITALVNVEQMIVKNNNGLMMIFNLQATQVSQQLLALQTCPVPALMADARAQAQKVAGAVGFGVGPVLAMSNGNSLTTVAAPSAIAVAAFISPVLGFGQFLAPAAAPPPGCSITVKFGLIPN